ncbi:hypothetical protein ACIGKL_21650 [Pseudomonas sp. NPDC077186]|uniref:hypothetical protein n=1 Tax=Pseudomonas sp. NPDC077186 TaxID=3364421 RepID=UPI0037CC4B17
MARKESPETFGAYAVTIALYSFVVGISDAGFKNFLLSRPGVVAGSGDLYAVTSSLSILFISAFFLLLTLGGYSNVTVHLWMAITLEVLALSVLHKGVMFEYQLSDKLSVFSIFDIWGRLVYGGIKILSYLFWGDVLLSIFVSASILFLFYMALIYRTFGQKGLRALSASRYLESMRLFFREWRGWMPFALAFLAFYLHFTSNRLIVSFLLGEEALAVFAAAYLLISLGEIPVSVIWALYLPKVSSGGYEKNIHLYLLLMSVFSVFLVICYGFFSLYIFDSVFPESYSGASSFMLGMSIYFLFRYPNLVFEIFFAAEKKYLFFTKFRLFSAVLGVLVNALLIPIYGIWVAVTCVVLCEALITAFCIVSKFNAKIDNC